MTAPLDIEAAIAELKKCGAVFRWNRAGHWSVMLVSEHGAFLGRGTAEEDAIVMCAKRMADYAWALAGLPPLDGGAS